MSRIYAVISPASPRYSRWLEGLGRDHVAVTSAEPEVVDFADLGPTPAHLVDLDALGIDELWAIGREIAGRWEMPVAEVVAELLAVGLPILAADLVICTDPAEGRARIAAALLEGGGA